MTFAMPHMPRTILVMVADPATAAILRESLTSFGRETFDVEFVREPSHGLERLGSRGRAEVAAVIADLCPPGSTGPDTLNRLLGAARQIPVLLVCHACDEEAARRAVRCGAQDYLPIDRIDGYSLPKALTSMIGRQACADAADAARRAPEQAQLTLNSIGDAVISVDINGKISYMNAVAERMTGWQWREAQGRPLPHVLHVIDAQTREPALNPLAFAIRDDMATALSENSILVRRDGHESAVEDTAAPIHDQNDHVIGAVMVFHDVSAARAMSLRMSHLAQHDFLTQLPNRLLLGDRLTRAMATADRYNRPLAVLYVDVDHFKRVNDAHGHAVGDQLLQSIAARLRECVRESDTVSRYGGDEFVILLSELDSASDAALSADRILAALRPPHRLGGQKLQATVSIGIGIYPSDGADAETILRNADIALLDAKRQGRNLRQFYRPDIDASDWFGGSTERNVTRSASQPGA